MTHSVTIQRAMPMLAAMALFAADANAASGDAPAPAPESMFIAAGQVAGQGSNYATAGVMVPLPGSKMGEGWVARVFADEISYRYKTGTRTIDATAPGGSLSFGYQHGYTDGWVGAYAGIAYNHTHLSPDDTSSRARGNDTAAHLQLEGEQHLSKDFKLNGNASVDVSSNTGYWSRLRALYRVTGDVYLGPEGVYQGDQDYKAWEAGMALVGIPITQKSSLGFDAGIRKAQDVATSGYAGLEFGANF